MIGKTLFEKIWDTHVIHEELGHDLLFVDRQLAGDPGHELITHLNSGRELARPNSVFATPDHCTPTTSDSLDALIDPKLRQLVVAFDDAAKRLGIQSIPWGDNRRGIMHVVGPEQGITLPGLVMVCTDSHTSTHGALGCIAFGIGESEAVHVLATQTIWQARPRTMRINIEGLLGVGISAKDLILTVIGSIGAAGGTGYAIEFAGSAIRALSMEGRLTLCNMTIEAGSRIGMVAPDEQTYAYLEGRSFAPSGSKWEHALDYWRTLPSDPQATFDREVHLDAKLVTPMVSWGTSPQDVVGVQACVPDPLIESDPDRRAAINDALVYMGLEAGMAITDITVDRVFIGACTNSRITDLRAAAAVVKGRKAKVPAMVVAGSEPVKHQAEREGLDQVFRDAGLEWRVPGCSMCVGMNGDRVPPGERCASTSNRNFKGRQGPGARTHLVSPAMAAAAAVTGKFTDVRELLEDDDG